MSKHYQYRYTTAAGEPLLRCPWCGRGLVERGAITLEVVGAGKPLWLPTRLHTDGRLEDVDDLVAAGYHSATYCAGCAGMLINMEDVVEDDGQ